VVALLDTATAPGQPHAYKFASNDIIATLNGLLKTFKGNLNDLNEEETETKNDYEMESQARGNTIKFSGQAIDEKAKLSADKESEKSQTEEEKTEETADMEADQAFMDELTEECETKAKDFDSRSKSRSGEITALSEALEIMKSGVQPNAGANKKLVGLLSTKRNVTASKHGHWVWVEDPAAKKAATAGGAGSKAPSFLQLRDEVSAPQRVLGFITRQALLLKSPMLSTLAFKLRTSMRLSLGKDHFVKIRGIIKDLVAKLEADAEAEADQKAYCDEEMGKALEARDEANGKIEAETANIDAAESKIAKLTEDIDELSQQIADLRKGLFEATELRNEEKAGNEQTLADAEAGNDAIKGAIKVLKGFYGIQALLETSFTPKGAGRDGKTVGDLAPSAPSGDYEGNKDAAAGIFGLLEVIQSDFERTLETVAKEEEDAVTEFEKFEKDSEKDIDDKAGTKKDKEKDRESTEADLTGFQEELHNAKQSLADAKEELAKLKPLCVDTGASWAEQRARQKQEIEALKQALQILSDWKN